MTTDPVNEALKELALTLSSKDFARLINMRLSDFECFLGLAGKACMQVGLESASANGSIIQLNVPAFGPVFGGEDEPQKA